MKMQNNYPPVTRRGFLEKSATAAVLAAAAWDGEVQRTSGAEESPDALNGIVESIRDADVRAGMQAAVFKNLLPAAVEQAYPGHFNISADGGAYGGWATWPGLDSWQMAGAYLLLGRTRMVLDYFEFVKASQRANGDIPFAIFTGDTKPDGTHLNGLKHPDDVFTYDPPVREGLPQSSRESRRWIGLFTHWLHQAEALSTLGSVCYVLTAAEVFDHTGDREWLRTRLPSIAAAAKYLLSRKSSNGLVARSGFYTEMPPRYGWDGVAQCYVIHAFRELARITAAIDDKARGDSWTAEADRLQSDFQTEFWREDHFAEYVHAERGVRDTHGLADTNFAAVAFGIADAQQRAALWPKLTADTGFWWGGMPTLPVTKPFSYEKWECDTLRWLDFKVVPMDPSRMDDCASMGRTWYLDAMASLVMGDKERLLKSTQLVCAAGVRDNGYWRERYLPQSDGSTRPAKAEKYCEYPAVLTRVVLGNRDLFV